MPGKGKSRPRRTVQARLQVAKRMKVLSLVELSRLRTDAKQAMQLGDAAVEGHPISKYDKQGWPQIRARLEERLIKPLDALIHAKYQVEEAEDEDWGDDDEC